MPDVSSIVDQHVRTRSLELGVLTTSRKRAYLDKCFWIHLRDVQLNRSTSPSACQLLEALRAAVASGTIVCPVSDILFLELMQQADQGTRLATGDLIDELSQGIALIPQDQRIRLELEVLLLRRAGASIPPIEEQVWSKVGYVLGVLHPDVPASEQRDQVQIGFFDFIWQLPMRTLLKVIGDNRPPSSRFAEQAALLNELNAEHGEEFRSFPALYKHELRELVDLVVPSLDAQQNLLSEVKTRDGRQALRTLHLQALFHAAIRWNRRQRLVANDLPDLAHAQAGVAYCDAIFTDGPVKHMLSQQHLRLSEDFTCFVAATPDEALAWVQRDG